MFSYLNNFVSESALIGCKLNYKTISLVEVKKIAYIQNQFLKTPAIYQMWILWR